MLLPPSSNWVLLPPLPQLLLGAVTPHELLGAITPPALTGCCYSPSSSLSFWGHQSEEVSLLPNTDWIQLGDVRGLSCTSSLLQVAFRKVWLLTQPVLVGSLGVFWAQFCFSLILLDRWSDMLSALCSGASQIIQVHIWTARPETAGRCLDCLPV